MSDSGNPIPKGRATFARRDGKRVAVMSPRSGLPSDRELAIAAGAFHSFSKDARLFFVLPKEPGPYTFRGWLSSGVADRTSSWVPGAILDYQGNIIGTIEPGDCFIPLPHEGKSILAVGEAFAP
jgi:hypothetical protein